MTAPQSVRRLVTRVRDLYGQELPDAELWARIVPELEVVLTDPEMRSRARDWPPSHDPENQRYTNLLFYEDPDHGFVLNGLVKDRTGQTPVHDHGHAWVAYGLMEGEEMIVRYQSTAEAEPTGLSDVEIHEQIALRSGEVDLVPPWTFHAERADTDRTVAIMVRSAKVGTFSHRRFSPETGLIYDHPGPHQIPYELA